MPGKVNWAAVSGRLACQRRGGLRSPVASWLSTEGRDVLRLRYVVDDQVERAVTRDWR